MLNICLVASTFKNTGNHAQKSEAAKVPSPLCGKVEALKTQRAIGPEILTKYLIQTQGLNHSAFP